MLEHLPKNTKTKLEDLVRSVNRAVKPANLKVNQETALNDIKLGKTYNIQIGSGDEKLTTIGTVVSITRLNKSVDPWTMGDIDVEIAVNKPGGSDDYGIMKRSLGQVSKWAMEAVYENNRYNYNQTDVLKKYHETLAETSTTTEKRTTKENNCS